MVGINRLCTIGISLLAFLDVKNLQAQTKSLNTHSKVHTKGGGKIYNKCKCWVSNISTGDVHPNDFCFTVLEVSHNDMHELNSWEPRKKTDEFWRYAVSISDNKGGLRQSFQAAYYLYEETSEIKQYHCLVEDEDCRAVIFDKIHGSWEIVIVQNNELKVMSTIPSFNYLDAFGIKTKSVSNANY